MTTFPIKAILAAAIGLGSLAAIPASAMASDTGLRIDVRDRWHQDDRGMRRDRCAPGFALDKAERSGLRRARVVMQTPARIVVEGWRFNHRDRMVFANDRGCPIIRR